MTITKKHIGGALTVTSWIFGAWGLWVTISSSNASERSAKEQAEFIQNRHFDTQECIQEKTLELENSNKQDYLELLTVLDDLKYALNEPQKEIIRKVEEKVEERLFLKKDIESKLVGFVDPQGKYIIPPIYNNATAFNSYGLSIVRIGKDYGVIDKLGSYIVHPEYQKILQIQHKRIVAIAKDFEKTFYYSVTGELIDTKPFSEIIPWADFRELVMGSKIEDKDLILRILEMYPTASKRNREIINLSATYREIEELFTPFFYERVLDNTPKKRLSNPMN